MRDLINLIESAAALDEAGAGPARIVKHVRDGAKFFMISAMRSSLPHAENLKRTEVLKRVLAKNSAVTFIETDGEYHEDGADAPSPEKSFFVMPRSPKTNFERFVEFGTKMMKVFQQDSIIVGDGDKIDLIENNGERFTIGDATTWRPEVVADQPGFSQIKKRKFSVVSKDDVPTAVPYGADKGKPKPAKPVANWELPKDWDISRDD